MSNNKGVLSIRLTPDILAAAAAYAEQAGVSLSEWVREVVYRAVYKEPATMDQGYMQGRAIGYQVVVQTLRQLEENLPPSVEEGSRYLQSLGGRVRKR
jgi:hypothetical protein